MWPDTSSPGYGSFVRNVAEGLKAHGYSIARSALIKGRPQGKKGKMRRYLSFYWKITKGFLSGGYDMIYIHFPNQAVPVLEQLFRLRQPKMAVNYHGEDLLYDRGGYTEKLGKETDRFLKKYADLVVVPSSYFKNIVVDRGIAKEDNVVVSPSGGISEEVFYPLSENAVEIPSVFTPERPLRIGYVGRLEEEKGILEFMKALAALIADGIAFKATVVGYGSLETEAVNFMKENGMEDRVEFVGGKAQNELGAIYRDMDLFIFPTCAPESLGLTGIEAMACGIPVIGSDVGGIATYLEDGVNGFLARPGDVKDLVGKIEGFTRLSADRRREMRKECIATGRKFYSDKVCRDLSECFDRMLNEGGEAR